MKNVAGVLFLIILAVSIICGSAQMNNAAVFFLGLTCIIGVWYASLEKKFPQGEKSRYVAKDFAQSQHRLL